jgi:hypothetical protein
MAGPPHGELEFAYVRLIKCRALLVIRWRSIPSIQFWESQKLMEALQLHPHSDPGAALLEVVVTYYKSQSIWNPLLESWA